MRAELKNWRTTEWLLALLVAASAFSHGLTPLRSTQDFWWNLKAGKVIVNAGHRLPENDIFAFTSENLPWYNHEWLTQVAMYHVYALGERLRLGAGVKTVITAKAAALAVTFLLLFILAAARGGNAPAAALILVVAINASRWTMYPRPFITSYFLLAVFMWIVHGYVLGGWRKRWLTLLPVLTVAWVNAHGGFILGLILLGGFWLGELALWLWRRRRPETREEAGANLTRAKWLFVCLAACTAATALNPYHVHIWEMYLRVMGDARLVGSVPELLPPKLLIEAGPFEVSFFQRLVNVPFFLLVAFVALGALTLGLVRKRWPHPGEALAVLFFAQQALSHVRHLPVFAITAAPLAAWILTALLAPGRTNDSAAEEAPPEASRGVRFALAALALLFAAYTFVWQDSFWSREFQRRIYYGTYLQRNRRLLAGDGERPGKYPEELCRFILSQPFRGRMFNTINDAGYLIWRLSPERHKVFTDDRYDIFGGRFAIDEAIIRTAQPKLALDGREQPGWRELLDDWKINFAIIGVGENVRSDGLAEALTADAGWALVYYPRVLPNHLIFVRNEPENQELIASCRATVLNRDGAWRWPPVFRRKDAP